MVLQTSGPIKLGEVNTELGRSSTATIGMRLAEIGTYAPINQDSALRPDGVAPHRISEWYGYDHLAGTLILISAGGPGETNHSLGILTTGVAYAWGGNLHGQLGDGTTTTRLTPVRVCGGLTFTAISAGAIHSLGITSSGVAYAWGSNRRGQLGDGTTTDRNTPVQVCGGLTFTAISAAGRLTEPINIPHHSLGITSTGVAYAWGDNLEGQLGDGTTTSRQTPVQVCGGLTFTAISAGSIHSLGITSTGAAYGWGFNFFGNLGDGTSTTRLTPVQVCGGLTFTTISAGDSYSLGITSTGVAYSWGFNGDGRGGDGTTTFARSTPVQVCGGLTFTAISAGGAHSLGITSAGVAYGWGFNGNGRLGDGTETQRLTPVQVCGGLTFTAISAGAAHSLGITSTGVAYAWGFNGDGRLGDGTDTQRLTPVQICL